MPNYTNFDQVLNDRKLSLPTKDAFARRWLESTYGIDYDVNTAFFDELTRVHDHDQQPLHFGRVLLQNAAGAIFVHLIKDPASRKWRLALIFPENQEEALVLDPADTAADGALTQFKNMLAAPPAVQQLRAVDPSRPYADLEAYSNGSLTDEDSRAQHRGSYDPASIPGFLLDPDYVPGIPGAQTKDPTIGVSLEDALRRLGHAA